MKFASFPLLVLLASSMPATATSTAERTPALRRVLDSSDDGDELGVSARDCKREIEMGTEVEFECKAKTETDTMEIKDKIKFKIENDPVKGLKVKVKYEQEIETEEPKEEKVGDEDGPEEMDNTSEQEMEDEEDGDKRRRKLDNEQTTETEYEVKFYRMIEYTKSGESAVTASTGGDAYDWEQDTIINSMDLTNLGPFSAITTNPDGSFTWNVATVDGVVTFIFTIFLSSTGEVSANKMKIDVDIKGYSWLQSNSNLALLSDVESKVEVDVDYDDDEESVPSDVVINFGTAVDASVLRPFGEFSWAKDAFVISAAENNSTEPEVAISMASNETNIEAATTTIQVLASSPSDGSDNIAFSFVGVVAQGAEEIFWDPEAGIGYESGLAGVSIAMALASMSMLAGFLL